MAENKKEVSLNEIEQVTGGGIVAPRYCRHNNKSLTGESKVENGVVYYQLKCDKCGELFWEKGSDLMAPASEK